MSKLLFQALLYLPPLLVGVPVYQRLKRKYARPLGQGADPRVYLYSAAAIAAGYVVYTALLALVMVLIDHA